jgi:hypothetical protein
VRQRCKWCSTPRSPNGRNDKTSEMSVWGIRNRGGGVDFAVSHRISCSLPNACFLSLWLWLFSFSTSFLLCCVRLMLDPSPSSGLFQSPPSLQITPHPPPHLLPFHCRFSSFPTISYPCWLVFVSLPVSLYVPLPSRHEGRKRNYLICIL